MADPLLTRRAVMSALAVAAIAGAAAPARPARTAPVRVTVYKDPNCGCCTAWAERMAATGRFTPLLVNDAAMVERKLALRVPPELVSCHTSVVGGYVIEGHVPAADILNLMRTRPAGIIGLGVPGMPAGSPGMEMPDGRRDPYVVFAFTAAGEIRPFARYPRA